MGFDLNYPATHLRRNTPTNIAPLKTNMINLAITFKPFPQNLHLAHQSTTQNPKPDE
jgi:hypothetical protein